MKQHFLPNFPIHTVFTHDVHTFFMMSLRTLRRATLPSSPNLATDLASSLRRSWEGGQSMCVCGAGGGARIKGEQWT